MIYKKPGFVYRYERINYTIGEPMKGADSSKYAGLSGWITEIRDKKDQNPDNIFPDFYCAFFLPGSGGTKQLDEVIVSPYDISPAFRFPPCFTPEDKTSYAMCIGQDFSRCKHCVLFVHLDYLNEVYV